MNKAQVNKKFLAMLEVRTKAVILDNIAKHYGITADEAYAEVTEDEAEHLLDYVTGPLLPAAHLLMKSAGLSV